MATGGNSDQLNESKNASCSSCSEDRHTSKARHYCVDCALYFCSKCVQCHKIIPTLRSHQLNDVDVSSWTTDDDNEEGEPVSKKVMRCSIHEDKPNDTYCKDHDEICCGSCAIVKHRSCMTLTVSDAAKGFNSNPEVNECKEKLKNALKHFNQEKTKLVQSIDSICEQKIQLIESIDKYEEAIIAKIKGLANTSRNEIRSKYETYKAELDKDIETIDVVITTMATFVEKLGQTDDELLFSNVATSRLALKDAEVLKQTTELSGKEKELKIFLNKSLEKTVDEMKSLSCLDYGYTSIFLRNANLKDCGSNKMTVFNMLVTDTGDLLVTDHDRKSLMRYSSELMYKDKIKLPGHPSAVCKLENHEICVRIWDTREIYTVSLGQTMQLKHSFTVAKTGYGMAYDADVEELFACEGNQVSVYSKTGNHLRTYDTDENGEQIFSACRQIAVSVNKDIYVTDKDRGLFVLDKTGKLKKKISSLDFDDTWPLCLLPGHICFVGSLSTGKVCQIDKDGNLKEIKIDSNVGRTRTYCIVYDHGNSRLVIAGNSSIISIYTLHPYNM